MSEKLIISMSPKSGKSQSAHPVDVTPEREHYFESILYNIKYNNKDSMRSFIGTALDSAQSHIQQTLISGRLKIGSEPMPTLTRKPLITESITPTIKKKKPRMKRMLLKPITRKAAEDPQQAEPEVKVEIKKREYSWLTEKDRDKWKNDWQKKTEETNQFVKKMKEIQNGIKERKKAGYDKLLMKIEKDVKIEVPSLDLLEQRKQRREEERKNKFESKRTERMEILKLAKAGAMRSKEIHQNVKSKIDMPHLQQAKKSLAEKRSIHGAGGGHSVEAVERERRYEEILHKYGQDREEKPEESSKFAVYVSSSKNAVNVINNNDELSDSREDIESGEDEREIPAKNKSKGYSGIISKGYNVNNSKVKSISSNTFSKQGENEAKRDEEPSEELDEGEDYYDDMKEDSYL